MREMVWQDDKGNHVPVQARTFSMNERDVVLLHLAANAFSGFILEDIGHIMQCMDAMDALGGAGALHDTMERTYKAAAK